MVEEVTRGALEPERMPGLGGGVEGMAGTERSNTSMARPCRGPALRSTLGSSSLDWLTAVNGT